MGRKVMRMGRNVAGPSGSWRRRWVTLLSLVVVVGAGLFFVRTVQAVHDNGIFELDRNALDAAGTQGEDWETIYKSKLDPPTATTTASASVFVHDGAGPTIFTQGGSKDDLDTTNWRHKSGSSPDKDELLDGFAARYGDILYFGADRTANNGDAVMGVWFFQEEVTAQPGGLFGPGKHQDGDILVLSDFTGGGGNVTIRVFQWNGPGGSIPGSGAINGTLDLLAGDENTPADCVGPPSTPANDPYCATVNTSPQTSPWPFSPKVGVSGQFATGEFFEGGIDLAFLNLGEECFASFLIETRSSTSVDSQLKDFVGGAFERCESSVVTTPVDANGVPVTQILLGQSVYDHALITGTGSNVAPEGTMDFYICAPDELDDAGTIDGQPDNPNTCDLGGTAVSLNVAVTAVSPATTPPSSEATSGAFTPDAIGTWCWRGEYSGDTNGYPPATDASTGECFTVVQIQPTIATVQTWTVQDKATIAASAGGNLTGNVVFELFVNDSTCAGTAVFRSPASGGHAVSGPSPQDVNSNTYTIPSPGGPNTYSWKVVYTSTNPAQLGVTSACHTENATLTYTNGGS